MMSASFFVHAQRTERRAAVRMMYFFISICFLCFYQCCAVWSEFDFDGFARDPFLYEREEGDGIEPVGIDGYGVGDLSV